MSDGATRAANDSALKADVVNSLRLETFLDRGRMGVEVSGGVVFLTGFVETFAEKAAADRAARHAAGPAALVVGARIKRQAGVDPLAVVPKAASQKPVVTP